MLKFNYRSLCFQIASFVCKLKQFCIELQQHQCQGGRKFDAKGFVFHSATTLNEEVLINAVSDRGSRNPASHEHQKIREIRSIRIEKIKSAADVVRVR